MRRQSLRYDDICPRQLTETKKNSWIRKHICRLPFLGVPCFIFRYLALDVRYITMTCEAANFTEVTVSIGWNHMQSLV